MKKIITKLLLALMLISLISINVYAEDDVVYVEEESDLFVEDNAKEKTIVLTKDITLNKELVISKDTNLYLNGKTLTVQKIVEDGESIKKGTDHGILVNKTLNIYGGDPKNKDGEGIIQGAYAQTDEGKELESGVLIHVSEKGTLNLYSGTLRYGCSVNGGGIANEGTTNMYGGLITSCLAEGIGGGHGGAIWNGNKLNIYDGKITSCSAHVGGGIYNWLDAETYIEKLAIEGCSAGESGGGIYTAGDSTLIVHTEKPNANDLYEARFLIKECSAGYIGGAIAINPGDKIELKGDVMIVLNQAPRCAGIANAANGDNYPGYLKIAGKVIIMGNSDGYTRLHSNIGILADSYVTVDGNLLPGTELGFHMYQFNEKDVVMINLDPSIILGENKDISITPDNEPIKELDDEGDALINDNGTVRINLATFEVSFDSDGYGDIKPQYVQRGRYATEPKLKKKYGYVFDGWYNDELDHIYWDFPFSMVEMNMTLKAYWNEFIDSDDISTTIDLKEPKDLSIKYTENFNDISAIAIYSIDNDTEIDRWKLSSNEELPYEIKDLGEGRKQIILHKSYLKTLKEGKYELQLFTQKMDEYGEYYDNYLTSALFEIKKYTPRKDDFKSPSTGIE